MRPVAAILAGFALALAQAQTLGQTPDKTLAPARPIMATAALGSVSAPPRPADLLRPFDTPLPLLLKTAAEPQRVEALHCADWLKLRATAVGSDNDAAWRVVRFQTVPCEALALLLQARPAAHSALAPASAPELATAAYPGALWPDPSAQAQAQAQARRPSPGTHLARASGQPRWKPAADGSLSLQNQRWRVSLTLLALGDFDGDGWEDAAYRWQAESRQGSYADSRLLVLTRQSGQAGHTVLDTEALLAAAARKR